MKENIKAIFLDLGRCETAPVVALTATMYATGNLG